MTFLFINRESLYLVYKHPIIKFKQNQQFTCWFVFACLFVFGSNKHIEFDWEWKFQVFCNHNHHQQQQQQHKHTCFKCKYSIWIDLTFALMNWTYFFLWKVFGFFFKFCSPVFFRILWTNTGVVVVVVVKLFMIFFLLFSLDLNWPKRCFWNEMNTPHTYQTNTIN